MTNVYKAATGFWKILSLLFVMISETQKETVQEIEEMKKRIQGKVFLKDFCWIFWEEDYVYSMKNLNGMFIRYLGKVREMVQGNGLKEEVFLNFKNEVKDILYNAAEKRREFKWALYFQEEY
jgi:hypothetical protein